MTAFEVLRTIRSKGITVHLAGDRIALSASSEPEAEVRALIEELRKRREAVKTLLALEAEEPGGSADYATNNSAEYLDLFTLVVTRSGPIPDAPVALNGWCTVVNVKRFVDETLADLKAYVAARNAGRGHWMESVLDEKAEHLRLCGVQAEVREVQ